MPHLLAGRLAQFLNPALDGFRAPISVGVNGMVASGVLEMGAVHATGDAAEYLRGGAESHTIGHGGKGVMKALVDSWKCVASRLV